MREWIDIKPGETLEVEQNGIRVRIRRAKTKGNRFQIILPKLVAIFEEEQPKELQSDSEPA